MIRCTVCEKAFVCENEIVDVLGFEVCKECAQKYPPFLIKALNDVWYGYVALRNGHVLRWGEDNPGTPKIQGNWVYFPNVVWINKDTKDDFVDFATQGRGVWVRLDDIVWIADGNS